MKLTKTAMLIASLFMLSAAPAVASEKITTTSDVECLIKVMNHEAGGEGVRGQKAVGYVVMNRAKSGRFPKTVCGVIYQKSQFTNITRARAIPANKYNALKSVANEIVSSYSKSNDPTLGSLFFHNTHVSPSWRNLIRRIQIGSHIFYSAK